MPDDLHTTYSEYAGDPAKQRAWAASNRGNQAIRRELARTALELAGDVRGDVLDVGCGTGWWLERLQGTGAALFGLEALEQRVEAARARVPGATVVHGDAAALPWEDGRFGLVTLFTVLS